ncbi:MAG: amidohydrolase family protein [Simkania negevensis]|nr:amidohydrolase family protein [Simkania negevensis]
MYHGEIIDTHMHLWDLTHGHYPWLQEGSSLFTNLIGDYTKVACDFLITDYLKLIHSHTIVKSVHVEAHPEPKRALLETMWVQKQADTYGFPHGIVVFADLSGSDLDLVLKDHCRSPNVRGVRQMLGRVNGMGAEDWMKNGKWQSGLRLLSKHELVFEVAVFDHQLEEVAKMAKEYDQQIFILEHLGWPLDLSPEGVSRWQERLALVADNKNVYLKLTALGCIVKAPDVKKCKELLLAGVKFFGEDRCLFGSNFPPDSLFFAFGQLLHIIKEALSLFDDKVQRKIFYDNGKKVYQL